MDQYVFFRYTFSGTGRDPGSVTSRPLAAAKILTSAAPIVAAVSVTVWWGRHHTLSTRVRRLLLSAALALVLVKCQKKRFHDINSQNKVLHHRQNKVVKCLHKLFYFCKWQNNSCNTTIFTLLPGAVFTPSKSVRAEHRVYLRQRLCRCHSN